MSTLPLTTVEKTAERTRRGLAKCVILMPVGGAIEPACEESLRKLEQRGYPVWRVRGYSAIDAARNQIATDALAQGFDELIWIDSDVVFRPEDVERLRSHCLPFVCGIYAKKSRREPVVLEDHEMGELQFACDGDYIATKPVTDVTRDDIIHMMVGRELTEEFPKVIFLHKEDSHYRRNKRNLHSAAIPLSHAKR